MTIEEAISHCEDVAAGQTEQGECPECAAEHRQLATWLRELMALRAQSKPLDRNLWKGCSECTVSYNREDWKSGAAHEFRIDEDSLFFFDSQRGWEGIEIKFCPICGKPLTEEAWVELERRIRGNDGKTDS